MSGGYFNYDQYKLHRMADEIDEAVADNDATDSDEYGDPIGRHYSEKTIRRFKEAAATLRLAGQMAQRVDWLLSDDDGEDSFHRRWEEEVTPLTESKG